MQGQQNVTELLHSSPLCGDGGFDHGVYRSGGPRVCVDLRRVALGFCSEHEVSTISVDTDGKANEKLSVSPLEGLLVEGTETPLRTWSMCLFTPLPSSSSTSNDKDPHTVLMHLGSHLGPAVKFLTNTQAPGSNVLSRLDLS